MVSLFLTYASYIHHHWDWSIDKKNHVHISLWDVINHQISDFIDSSEKSPLKFGWMSNDIPQKSTNVITYLCLILLFMYVSSRIYVNLVHGNSWCVAVCTEVWMWCLGLGVYRAPYFTALSCCHKTISQQLCNFHLKAALSLVTMLLIASERCSIADPRVTVLYGNILDDCVQVVLNYTSAR